MHAKQFKRANKALRKIRTYLGRVERDIARRIKDREALRDIFRRPLYLAERVREQRQKQRGQKVYSLHAPEVECIGKGKAHKPYEFGVKVSVAGPNERSGGYTPFERMIHQARSNSLCGPAELAFMKMKNSHVPPPPHHLLSTGRFDSARLLRRQSASHL